MDTAIIGTIISTAATVIIFFVGVYLGRKNERKPTDRELYKIQLVNVLEPLYKAIEYDTLTVEMLSGIIKEQYSIVPVAIVDEYKTLAKDEKEDFSEIIPLIRAHYNRTRQLLGYPYDPKNLYKFFPKILMSFRIATFVFFVATIALFYLAINPNISMEFTIFLVILAFFTTIITLSLIGLFFQIYRIKQNEIKAKNKNRKNKGN